MRHTLFNILERFSVLIGVFMFIFLHLRRFHGEPLHFRTISWRAIHFGDVRQISNEVHNKQNYIILCNFIVFVSCIEHDDVGKLQPFTEMKHNTNQYVITC